MLKHCLQCFCHLTKASATPPWRPTLGNCPPSLCHHTSSGPLDHSRLSTKPQPALYSPSSISFLPFLWFPMVNKMKITIHNLLAVHLARAGIPLSLFNFYRGHLGYRLIWFLMCQQTNKYIQFKCQQYEGWLKLSTYNILFQYSFITIIKYKFIQVHLFKWYTWIYLFRG